MVSNESIETDFYAAELDPENEDLDYNASFYHYEQAVGAEPRSSQWPTVRKHHIERNPTCAACGTTDHIQVHHVTPFHIDPKLELDPENLISLCMVDSLVQRCHFEIGHHRNWKNSNPDVREEAASRLKKVKK